MINIYEVAQDLLAEKHYKAVINELNKKGAFPPSTYTRWFKRFDSTYTLKRVITAKPEDLRIIMMKCESAQYPPFIIKLYDMYVDKFSKSGKYIGKKEEKYNAVKLMKSIGVKVCPLCNRNFITNIIPKDRQEKRTGQFDHFHDKSTYPFLAMSFFNLVPACYGCNHTKGTLELDHTPYGKIDLDPLIRFSIPFNKIEDITDEKHVKVSLNFNSSIQKNIDVLGLYAIYTEEHNDVAYEVLKGVKNYTSLWKRMTLQNIEGLFDNEKHLRTIILGDFINLKDKLKIKPLAKLKKDVYEQLEGYCQKTGINI